MGSVDTWVDFWGRRGLARPAIAVGAEAVTSGALADRGSRLAAGLAGAGAAPGSRIGVLSDDPVRVIEVIAACARLGAIAVPMDPAGDPQRLRAIAAGADLSTLVTDSGLAAVLAPVLPPDRTFAGGPADGPADAGARRFDELLGQGRLSGAGVTGMDEPLLLLHTRGTTGAPRAAVLTHANVEAVAVAAIAADGLVPPDCVGIALPSVATPTGLATALGALHAGALIRFSGQDGPAALLGNGNLARSTVLVTTCEQLGSAGLTGRLAAGGEAGPRLVKVPGPVPTELRRTCQSLGIPLVEMYGLAEGGGLNLQQSPGRPPSGRPGPPLVPVLGQQARVVDAAGATVPAGQPGELVLAGSAVMRGYQSAGAERLPGDGWLRTGDLAVADQDGSLTILGRCPATSTPGPG